MSRPVFVHLLPSLFEPEILQDGVAVVIDVLRATSTIVAALNSGAKCIIPCGEVDEARQISSRFPTGAAILGGERGGMRISGFDFGNSPAEYEAGRVNERTIVFTTTNGTRALNRARLARRVLVAAMLNLSAVVAALSAESGTIHIVCAGTDGRVTLEDALVAGTIVHCLEVKGLDFDLLDDSTRLARSLYLTQSQDYDGTLALFRTSRGGLNLIDCGLDSDIAFCARVDQFAIVPELFASDGEIRVAGQTRA
jgi:2-phosphosulfolactate phosphatase